MGIDISPGGAHWAYSGFMRFRKRLASAEGLDLDQMQGYYVTDLWTRRPHPDSIPWSSTKTPLKRLLHHSDCDGFLTPKECARILPRLREIVESWPDGDYDKQEGKNLIAGMEECVDTSRWMKFH